MSNVRYAMPRLPLKSQPGSFWLGAFLVAEAPLVVIATFMDSVQREQVVSYFLSSPTALFLAVSIIMVLGLLVGLLAHRLGLGL